MRQQTYGATYPSLRGRVALVTGGGSGIGAEIVRHLAAQGARVGFIDLAKAPSQALAEELDGDVMFHQADLRDIDALRAGIDAVRAAFGPVTVLVNNAAHDQRDRMDEVTPEVWDDRQAVSLRHQFFAAQAVRADMAADGGGSIVNMGSTSYLAGSPDLIPYMTAKAGVVGLTRGLARELGPDGVRVNCVIPGWIMTERQRTLWLREGDEEALLARQCLKRVLLPEDIARAVLFFASDESGGCTNQSFIVDAGWV